MGIISANQFDLTPKIAQRFAAGMQSGQQFRINNQALANDEQDRLLKTQKAERMQQVNQFSGQALAGDKGALTKVAENDPEKAINIQNFLSKQSETEREEFRRENDVMTKVALHARTLPPEQVRPFIQRQRDRAAQEGRSTARTDRALQGTDEELMQAIEFQAVEGRNIEDIAKQSFGGGDKFGRVFSGEVGGERGFFAASESGQVKRILDSEGRPIRPPVSASETALKTKQIEMDEKRQSREESARQQASIVSFDIDRAIGQSGQAFTTGFTGSIASSVPGTAAHDLKETLTGIKANIGFNKLQDMRENSPTGGALGAISDSENKLLQSVFGSIEQSQSEPQLNRNLNRMKVIFNAVVHGTVPIPFTQSQFDKLDPGAEYISPDTGTIHRKP